MRFIAVITCILYIIGCKSITIENDINQTLSWYKPTLNNSWQMQIKDPINIDYDVDIYIVSLQDTMSSFIQRINTLNRKTMCYFSAGIFNQRTDNTNDFPSYTLGSKSDIDGQIWVNINSELIISKMKDMINTASEKRCSGVLINNLDAYTQNNGLNITIKEQMIYNKLLTDEAHKLGLSAGIMGIKQDIKTWEPYFDFALATNCHKNNECNIFAPFTAVNKAVFNIEFDIEYIRNANIRQQMCTDTKALNIPSLVLPIELNNEFRYSCQE